MSAPCGNRPRGYHCKPSVMVGKLKKETFWAALAKGSTLACFILINVVLARLFGRDKFGAWAYFYSAFSVIYLASRMGVGDSTRVFAARAVASDTRAPIIAGMVLQALFSSLFSLGLLASATLLATLMHRPEFVLLFRLGALLVFTQGATDFLKLVFEGLHRLRFTFTTGFLDYGLRIVLILTLVWAWPEPWSVLTAFVIATSVCAGVSLLQLERSFIRPSGGYVWKNLPLIPVLKYAAPMFLLNLGFAVSVELGTLMLGWLTTDAQVGIYAPAKEISARMMHGGVLLAMSTLQVFAHAPQQELPALRPLFHRLVVIAVVFYALCCAGILLFAGKVMPFLFGAEFKGAATPMRLLTPFIFYLSISRLYSGVLDYRGRAWARVGYISLSVALNVALNVLLIPRFGAAGAAAATSLAYLPYALLSWWDVSRIFRGGVQPPHHYAVQEAHATPVR